MYFYRAKRNGKLGIDVAVFEPGIFSTKMVICPLCHYEGLPAAEGDDRNLRLGIMHLGISSISNDEGVL